MSNVLRAPSTGLRAVDWEQLASGDSPLAKVNASLARKAGFREGYEKGRADGAREALARLETALGALERARRQLNEAAGGVVRAAQREMLLLAVEIARRIGVLKTKVSPDVALEALREAVGKIPDKELTVRMNPRDAQAAGEALAKLSEGGLRRLTLVADEEVPPGGCVVEGASGWLDGRLDSQLDRIAEAILEAEGHQAGAVARRRGDV